MYIFVYLQHKALGGTLFNAVLQKLQLLEADYFDLEYSDHQGKPVTFFTTTWPIIKNQSKNKIIVEIVQCSR